MKIAVIYRTGTYEYNNLKTGFEDLGKTYVHEIPRLKVNSYTFEKKKEISEDIVNFIRKIKPDVTFCYFRNRWVVPEILAQISSKKINLSLDDSHKFKLVQNLAPVFDLNLTTTEYL